MTSVKGASALFPITIAMNHPALFGSFGASVWESGIWGKKAKLRTTALYTTGISLGVFSKEHHEQKSK